MYCRKCGSEIIEGNRFCEQCGTPVSVSPEAKDRGGRSIGKCLRGKKLVAVVAAIVVLFGGIGTVTAMMTQQKNADYTDKMSSAQQYLDNGDYEAAIETFDEAIRIRPKKVEAYIAKATAQDSAGDWQGAMETLKAASKIVNDKKTIDNKLEVIKGENNESMKSAYKTLLEENEDGIRLCEESFDDKGEALIDINDDGTPELFFFTVPDGATQPWAKLMIYGFDGEKAKELKYEYPANPSTDDEKTTDGYDETASTYSPSHILFKTKDGRGFVIYSIDQYSGNNIDTAIEYSMDKKMNIEIKHYIRRDGEENKWYENGEAIDESKYNEAIREIAEKVDKLMYLNGSGDEGDAMWEKAETMVPVSLSYDAMIKKLTIKGEDDKTGDSSKSEWYKETLALYKEIQHSYNDDQRIKEIAKTHDKELSGIVKSILTESKDWYGEGKEFYYQFYDLNDNGSDELYIAWGTPNTDDLLLLGMYVKDGSGASLHKSQLDNGGFIVLDNNIILQEYPFGEGVSEKCFELDENGDELIEIDYFYDDNEIDLPGEWKQIS